VLQSRRGHPHTGPRERRLPEHLILAIGNRMEPLSPSTENACLVMRGTIPPGASAPLDIRALWILARQPRANAAVGIVLGLMLVFVSQDKKRLDSSVS